MLHRIVLERPSVELPWGIGEAACVALLGNAAKRLTAGHIRVHCTLFGGFETNVDLYFKPALSGVLKQVEIKRIPSRHRKRQFDELQKRLEVAFGAGKRLPVGMDDIAQCRWQMGSVSVEHNYYYRGGLYEQVLITQNAA